MTAEEFCADPPPDSRIIYDESGNAIRIEFSKSDLKTIGEVVRCGIARDPHWAKFQAEFLAGKVCAACGGNYDLTAHHIIPVHVDKSREMDASNLLPLCEGRFSCNCHATFGHLGNWRLINPDAVKTAAEYRKLFDHARAKQSPTTISEGSS